VNCLGPSLRRGRKRPTPYGRRAVAIVLSLIVNAIALRGIRVTRFIAGKGARSPTTVTLAPLSPAEWEANRRAPPPRENGVVSPPQQAPSLPPPPRDKVKGQVVDVEPSKNKTRPKDSRFLSEQDSTVEKETRSRYARRGYQNTLAEPLDPRKQMRAGVRAGEAQGGDPAKGSGPRSRPQAPGREDARPPQKSRQKLALRQEQRGDLRVRDPQQGGPGNVGADREPGSSARPGGHDAEAGLGHLLLRPSAAAYDRLAGGPAPDKLDGVEEGEGTYLNTRGWKFASYFNRISRAVREQWDPNSAMQVRDPTGTRFGSRDWFTLLVVKLDDRGVVRDVQVQRSSGLDFLDEAAVQALRKAQPFVNPPLGLADEHGEIVFSYGFTLEGSLGIGRIGRRGPPE